MRYHLIKTTQKRTLGASDFPATQEVVPPGQEVSSAQKSHSLFYSERERLIPR